MKNYVFMYKFLSISEYKETASDFQLTISQLTLKLIGKLEGNCDFSSNSKVWTNSYAFLAAILNFVGQFEY